MKLINAEKYRQPYWRNLCPGKCGSAGGVQLLGGNRLESNGDWATYTSTLKLGGEETIPIYCVSHRRGCTSSEEGAVHKFVATCSTTLRGEAHCATFEDDEERANAAAPYELTRKAPRTVNDFSLGQPCIDRHNRCRCVTAQVDP